MHKICKCNGISHTRYTTLNVTKKYTGFNARVLQKVRDLLTSYDIYDYRINIMDSKELNTTKIVYSTDYFEPHQITAFTFCKADFRAMKPPKDINKRCINADDLYAEDHFRSGYHIVIDDGMNTGRITISRVKTLLNNGPKMLAVMFNICPRDRAGKSKSFERTVHDIAKKEGYMIIESIVFEKYSQSTRGGWMEPHWFIFKRN